MLMWSRWLAVSVLRSPATAQVTRSPAAVAAVTAMQSLPWLALGAGLGVLVNRTHRRRLMVIVDVTRAFIVAGLAAAILMYSAGLVLIYITAPATGTADAVGARRWRSRRR